MTTAREQARINGLYRRGQLLAVLRDVGDRRLEQVHRDGDLAVIEGIADAASDVWEERIDKAFLHAIERVQFTPISVQLLVDLRNEIMEALG